MKMQPFIKRVRHVIIMCSSRDFANRFKSKKSEGGGGKEGEIVNSEDFGLSSIISSHFVLLIAFDR